MSITFGNKSGNLSFVSNVGGGSTTIIEQADLVVEVKVDDNDNVIETSHTFEEVMAAYNESRMIALLVRAGAEEYALRLDMVSNNKLYFSEDIKTVNDSYMSFTTVIACWDAEGLKRVEQADTMAIIKEDMVRKGLATTQDVSEAIAGIEIPEVDLSGYALKTEIPDTSAFKTEEEIIALIEEYGGGAPLPSAEEVEF